MSWLPWRVVRKLIDQGEYSQAFLVGFLSMFVGLLLFMGLAAGLGLLLR